VIGPRLAVALSLLGLVGLTSGRAQASIGLDPFRRAGSGSAPALDPFRVADAKATPAPAPAPAPAETKPPAAAAPKACRDDNECPDGTICQQNVCQAIQATTNILYLYYREGSFREILGLYWSKRGSSGFTILAPLYWHAWTPQSEARVVAPPFFWRFSDYARRHVLTIVAPLAVTSSDPDGAFTYALPLNFYWRHKDLEHLLVFPIFYATTHKHGGSFYSWFGYDVQDGPRRSGAAAWLYWFGEDRSDGSSYGLIFPILWDFETRGSRSTVVFPLIWSFRSAESNTSVVGPWVHLRRGPWQFDTVLPLWWSASDTKAGSTFRALLPLFIWQTARHGRKLSWVSPIGGYSSDEDARSNTLTLWPILTFWRRDPQRQVRIFTPLYIGHKAYDPDGSTASTTSLTSLALYRREDPQGSTTSFLGLYWRFRDQETGASATALLPFFAHRAGPRDTSTYVGVFPLWLYWRSFTGGGWSAGLSPLLYFGKNAGRTHAVLFPFFWHWSGARDSTTVVAPFFYWHHEPRGYAGGVPPLLTFFGARDGDSYAVQFPLFWRFANAQQGTATTATPLGYFHSDPDGWSLGVGPIVPLLYARSGTTRSHFVLFPVLWHFRDSKEQRSTTVALLYWHRTWGGETTDALFPFLHYRRGARPGGADETSFTLFPVVHYRRDATTRVLITPLGASARGPNREAGFVGPYLWYKDADLSATLVPLLYADVTRKTTGEHTRQFGPWFQIDAPGRKSRVLFPLFGRYQDERETDTFVFPTYFRQRRTDGGRVDMLLPLFWHSSGGDKSTTVVGTWYDHTAPGVHNTGFAPFWFHARNRERSFTIIPPLLFFHRHDVRQDTERLWCALLWHTRDGEASRTTLFPFWWSRSAKGKGYQVLFPIFWHYADAKEHTASTLAGPLYWSSWGTGITRGLMPLAWYSRNPADGSGSTAFMPLFYEAHGPKRQTFGTLLFGYHRSPTAELMYAGPIVPLWIAHTDLKTDTRTTVIPPLLLYARRNPEGGLTTFLGLFWRHRDVVSSTTLALPLVFDVHDFHLSRTTLVLPFVLRHANEVERSVTWLAPLFYRHSSPTGSTTVGFPLYWDFERGQSRTTVVFPFFARWRRPDHTSTYVFPTIYHRTGLAPGGAPDGTWRTVVAPFYAVAVKRPGDFMWEILGGLIGHERAGRNRYLKLFFMRFEQEPAPRAQTAWYSQPVRTPRRQPARGLSMNTW
jgi:hypothetical protein